VIVGSNAGINTIADMRGKRVSTGAPNSGTEVIANRMLQAAGLDPAKDIQAQRTELGKTVEGMKDGSIDAMFWSGGLPTSGITDLFVSRRE
jgi:TRAP transporter TAXI family solute receptor